MSVRKSIRNRHRRAQAHGRNRRPRFAMQTFIMNDRFRSYTPRYRTIRCINALAPGALGIVLLAATGLSAARAAEHTLPLLPPAGDLRQGFARIINHSFRAGTVNIHGTDDHGRSHGPVTLHLDARAARHFNSNDLEEGNPSKGLSAGGPAFGDAGWDRPAGSEDRLSRCARHAHARESTYPSVLSVGRPQSAEHRSNHQPLQSRWHRADLRRVPIFNPGSNRDQVSWLRLANLTDGSVDVTIRGIDDAGRWVPEGVGLTLPARAARQIPAQQLESGLASLRGRLGDGTGKWRLFVEDVDGAIEVVSLLRSPTGHLSNLSTSGLVDLGELEITTAGPDHVEPLEQIVLQVPGGLSRRRGGRFRDARPGRRQLQIRLAMSLAQMRSRGYVRPPCLRRRQATCSMPSAKTLAASKRCKVRSVIRPDRHQGPERGVAGVARRRRGSIRARRHPAGRANHVCPDNAGSMSVQCRCPSISSPFLSTKIRLPLHPRAWGRGAARRRSTFFGQGSPPRA